jgi:MFS family permease
MKSDLALNYTQAGWLNAANGLGYLIGALVAFVMVRFITPARLFQTGVLMSGVIMVLTGMTRDLHLLSALRLASGLFAAPVFICGGVLVSAIFVHAPEHARTVTNLFFAGVGAGLMLCGLIVPSVFHTLGASAWPNAWLLLGLIAVAATPFAWWGSAQVPAAPQPARQIIWPWWRFVPAFFAYACFGAGYIIYLTFIVVWAAEQGASLRDVLAMWSTLGLASMVAAAFWAPLLPHLGRARQLVASLAVTAAGVVIALLGPVSAPVVLSAAVFGLAVFMVPSSVTSLARQALPREAWSVALAAFTIVFALAQFVGPAAAGLIADGPEGLWGALALSAGLLAAGALIALLQWVPDRPVHALDDV